MHVGDDTLQETAELVPSVSNDTPVPPLPPLTPELEEHERLRELSSKEAQAYREKLYARRR